MNTKTPRAKLFLKFSLKLFALACAALCLTAEARAQRPRRANGTVVSAAADARLTGVYRINADKSDRLYSVVSNASSSLPFGEQQRFFIDLTVRLTPPDQLAIRRTGNRIEVASSRAPRTTFSADGRERVERTAHGVSRERSSLAGDSLVLSSTGGDGESYRVTFTPADGGRELRVTRRISSSELNQPLVIQSVYDRISEVADWRVYGEPQSASPTVAGLVSPRTGEREERGQAEALRAALQEWVEATNATDIGRQMSFYMPRLLAYYLARDTPRDAVRAEKARVFEKATRVDINADEPEVVFLERGSVAVMRFRKRYRVEGGPAARSGEVVQELRWRRSDAGWKIYSERDIRVIR
ncbi:MAG TPA: nuclear transport factor 2 family protein [Pyrinomonadaceae bacterium]|nr:nuclear transport factor 2 family protein [Pyrinomonadaceae bacterium]